MSKEKKNTQNEKRKLSRQERKQIDTLIRQAKGDGKPHTAQDSIPFERMYKDGICRLANGRYSKCIEFEDINYQLAQPDDKTAIFEALCDMYNSFDASISVQLSLISRHANKDDFKNSITIAPQNDDFDSIRAEYTEMLRTQLERGNNGLIKTKFLTFTVEAKDIRSARARLARIETDTLNHFKVIGAAARVLDGKQRLEVLHGIFHPDGERFNFAWEWLPASGLSVKDFIAPSSFRFGDGRMFQMGGKFGAVSFLQIVAPELSDRMLADFMDAENGIIVNLHIQSIDHNEAIKTIKRKITDLDRMKIEEQKKAIRSGYDMDIIPSDLATYGGEAKNLLRDLQSRNERMFLLTLLVLNLADTKQKLDNEVFGAAAIAQKYNCILTRLDYRQEQGLMSSIPLGGKPYPYPARLDDQQHRRFRSLYGARAVPKRRSIVLRLKRPFQQHDFVRPKEAEKPQRLDTRHTGQRQKFFCKTRNHKRFSYHVRRHYHLRPRSRILSPCRTFERTGYQGFAEQHAVH